MHATGLHRAKFFRECRMHSTRPCNPCHAAECLAYQQDAEVGLASATLAPHMTGVVCAVVCHEQHLGCERGVQRRRQSVGPVR